MAAAGIVCGLLFVSLRAVKMKLDWENAVYIYTFGFIGAGVGAKILYLLLSVRDIAQDLKTHGFVDVLIAYSQGGMVFYGGFLGAISAAFLTAKYLRLDIKEYYPALVPGIAVLAGFGRIGCFLGGCCYGAVTSSHFAVVFPEGGEAPAGVPLVPVQLYEALFDALLFLLLAFVGGKDKIKPHLLKIYMASYAVFRFILEFWRGDEVRGIFGPFSTSQWISLVILAVVVFITLKSRRVMVK